MNELTRRDYLRMTTGSLLAGWALPNVSAQEPETTAKPVRPQTVAAVVTIYTHNS
jgi:hypothetical protein